MQEKLLRHILTFLLKLFFRLRVRGMEHFYQAGDRVLIIANHQSFLDPLLLAICMPEKPAFAMNVFQANKWYFRWVSKVVKIYTIDATKPMSMKTLLTDMKKGCKVVLFPEGRITTTGGIMKIYDGAELLLARTGASLLAVHIDGTQYSTLSRMKGKFKTRWFPRLSLTVQPPIFASEKPISSQDIYDHLTFGMYASQNHKRPLLSALLEAANIHSASHVIASDISRTEMNYRALFMRSFILSAKLKTYLKNERYVGVLLPNAMAAMVAFVTVHLLGKTPAMLNYSSGEANIVHACKITGVKYILTSRTFIEKANLQHVVNALQKEHFIIYLEDTRASISGLDKLFGVLKSLAPRMFVYPLLRTIKPYDPAVILYTSGSEGTPKGVALSHANVLANIYQSLSRLDLVASDRFFNALPVFHSFGLVVGMILPMLRGIYTFLYPSPLHYRVIPELVYDTSSTIMVGTDTFYQYYAHYAHPYDFQSIRLAVAGAERLKESTRKTYLDKFHVSIMQGYGVTETSPVISCNTMLYHKEGTVGRLFPAMEYQLQEVEGISGGGRLWIKGANVMLGYLKADNPGVIQPQDEWYDTGDIVSVDDEDYITILGRAKRFAKIGGEMVSLAAVEEFLAELIPNVGHAAIAVADERKGEQIIVYSEMQGLNRQDLITPARKRGVAEIFLPKTIVYIEAIPRLGNGKIDYPALAKLIG